MSNWISWTLSLLWGDIALLLLLFALSLLSYLCLFGYFDRFRKRRVRVHGKFEYPSFSPRSSFPYACANTKTEVDGEDSDSKSGSMENPYAWLDTPSQGRSIWIEEQRACTTKYINSLKTTREKFIKQYKKLCEIPKQGTPFQKGKFYFFFKKEKNQAQYVLWRSDFGENALEVLNPNTSTACSKGGRHVVSTVVSEDGSRMTFTG